MRRTLSLTLILAALLSTACAHPLSSLKRGMEHRNAYTAKYEPPTFETDACRAGVKHLEAMAVRLQIEVGYGSLPEELGAASRMTRVVMVHEGLNACGRLEVLSHELAHISQPNALGQIDAQVFAESVSYLVTRRLGGYDPKDRFLAYLGVLKLSSRVTVLYRDEIQAVVNLLTGPVPPTVDLR